MKCDNCGKTVTNRPRVTEVTGIVRDRKAGGIHQIRQAKPTGKMWCFDCGEALWYTGSLPSTMPEGQLTLA